MEGTGTPTVYTKLVDIKDFPDLGASPQTVETTTLSDKAQTFIKGIDASATLEFTANYDQAIYTTLLGMAEIEEAQDFAVFFGEDGTNGKFGLKGQLSVWVVGGGVNGIVEMKIGIVPSSSIEKIA
jgi:hypothetical protein